MLSLALLFDACDENFVFQVRHLHFHGDSFDLPHLLVDYLSCCLACLVIFMRHTIVAAAHRGQARKYAIVRIDAPNLERGNVSLLSWFDPRLITCIVCLCLLLDERVLVDKFFIRGNFSLLDWSNSGIRFFRYLGRKILKIMILVLVPRVFMDENFWEIRDWWVEVIASSLSVNKGIPKARTSHHTWLYWLFLLTTMPTWLFGHNVQV